MKKKICIIGGGIFGSSIYIKLKSAGYDCHLIESKDGLLKGATTNNLNRIHFGFHYPRDPKTTKQSREGYRSFNKFYKNSIIKNFPNYYLIAKNSKVNLKDYYNFCKKSKLSFKKVDLKKFPTKVKNIVGGVKVNEPIYDWEKLRKEVQKKINQINRNNISLNTKILEIKKYENNYVLVTNKKKNILADIVIDASYNNSNTLTKNIFKSQKFKYQLVFVKQFKFKKFRKFGIAVMDGKFFSFLPKGKSNDHLLYHVKYSIIRQTISKQFNPDWLKIKKNCKEIKVLEKKMFFDFKKYFPMLEIKSSNKIYISPRLILSNVEKTDKRASEIRIMKSNYFKIISGKVDHSVDIAEKMKKILM